MEKYLGATAHDLGLFLEGFPRAGREEPNNEGEDFCLTILALRLSAFNNG